MKNGKKDNLLESYTVWRLIRVIYIAISILLIIFISSTSIREVNECYKINDYNYVSLNTGSGMAHNRLIYNIQNGQTNCNVDETRTWSWLKSLITPLALIAGYFILKPIFIYILAGNKKSKDNIV